MKKINLKEFMEIFPKVLSDSRPPTDVTYVHGSCVDSPDLDSRLLGLAADLLRSGQTKLIVIDGLPVEKCKGRLPYPGYEIWHEKLLGLGVPTDKIEHIAASQNTGDEADNFIPLAGERGWASATIISSPHHLPRCMLTQVSRINKVGSKLKIYARTLENDSIDWFMPAKRQAYGEAAPVEGTLFDHIGAELTRIRNYMFPDDPQKIPIATPEEFDRYLSERDKS